MHLVGAASMILFQALACRRPVAALMTTAIASSHQAATHRSLRFLTSTTRSTFSAPVLTCTPRETDEREATTHNTPSSPEEIAAAKERRKEVNQARKAAAKAKRKLMRGLPKAVDRGQYATVYQPRPFTARSGGVDCRHTFTVLGIESSCDDTGAAIVRSDGSILGEGLASQDEIHAPWGGVVPGLARDAHEAQIDAVVATALRQANLTSVAQVDAIAVTVGPGLEICLRVGATKARTLARDYGKPFVGVHHLEAHILMAGLMPPSDLPLSNANDDPVHHLPATASHHAAVRRLAFPFLALLVSGGHCQLIHCQEVGRFEILGGTLDDSLGEALDKTARLLWGPGAGGAVLETWAQRGDATSIALPLPLARKKNCNFSYAGLKTAARLAAEALVAERDVEAIVDLAEDDKANLAASFQHKAFAHVEQRLKYAMAQLEEDGGGGKEGDDDKDATTTASRTSAIRTLAVVGGVAANQELRRRLQSVCAARGWRLVVPPPRYCTDQGAMSAWAGVERLWRGSSDDPTDDADVYARYPFAKLQVEDAAPGGTDKV
jgi:N6-L-threonylcarbamoyladenine synthase